MAVPDICWLPPAGSMEVYFLGHTIQGGSHRPRPDLHNRRSDGPKVALKIRGKRKFEGGFKSKFESRFH